MKTQPLNCLKTTTSSVLPVCFFLDIVPTWVSALHPLVVAHVRQIFKLIIILWVTAALFTWERERDSEKNITTRWIFVLCSLLQTFLSLRWCIADVWGLWRHLYVGQASEAVYFLLRWNWESITDAAAAAQTPMTVYYRQFQTSYAHGLNIANGDSRQVPPLQWWWESRQRVCCGCVCWREVGSLSEFVLWYTRCVCVCFLAKGTTGVHRLWSWGVMRGWGQRVERSKTELLPATLRTHTHTDTHTDRLTHTHTEFYNKCTHA